MLTVEKIQAHAESIADGTHESIHPGMAFRFSEASTSGDGVWQGDLGIEIVSEVPKEYVRVAKTKAIDRKLVPGATEGSRHELDSLKGVKIYRPETWNEESLQGPCLVFTQERVITHPKHGHVTIPDGFTVLLRYQREFDKELQQERRTRD